MTSESSEPAPTGPEPAGEILSPPLKDINPSRIDALIRLLADDDPRVLKVVKRHLKDWLTVSRPYLEDYSRENPDPRVRVAAGDFLKDLLRDDKLASWREFARAEGDLDLETGAFLIAAVEFPETDIAPYRKMLDEFGSVLERRLSAARNPDAVAGKLIHLLFRELGFQGNSEDYYNPDNSYLTKVLDRKLGIPISMSALAMLVARRIGFELEGIGMPGHFLVRYRSGRKETFFDPFRGGKFWTIEDCRAHLRGEGYEFQEEFLRTCTAREMMARMIENLLNIYRSREDEERVARLGVMVGELYPKTVPPQQEAPREQ